MKKLCFGTVFTLLCQIKNSTNQNFLYKYLVTPSDPTDSEPDKGSVGRRKKGEDDFPQPEKDYFNNTELEQIVALYRIKLASSLRMNTEKKSFIVAIKDVLVEDTSIADTDEIGGIGYTKQEICEKNTFDFFLLLAQIMKYCSNITNTGYERNINEICPSFIKDRQKNASTIYLMNTQLGGVSTPLELSVDDRAFASVFTEVNPNMYSLSLPNPNKVKIFKLRLNAKEFDQERISDYILNNISQYVYSRTKIKNIESYSSIRTISTRAIREIEKTPAFSNQTQTFCEIMLYSFLECSMHAPKILSGFEVNESGRSNKYSSGIYLLPAGAISPNNQIVFGCTKAHDSLLTAIDDVLTQANEIMSKILTDLGKDLMQEKNYKVVTSASDKLLEEEHNFIFIMTPERFLYLMNTTENKVEYLFIDEAHKISSKDARSPFYYELVDKIADLTPKPHIIFSSPNNDRIGRDHILQYCIRAFIGRCRKAL